MAPRRSFYCEHVLPPLLNLAMSQRELIARRGALIPHARGRVLEIGIGCGLNLPLYGPAVERLAAIDPSPALLQQTRQRANSVSLPVELHECSAENLPFDGRSFDTAVTRLSPLRVATSPMRK